MLLNHKWNILNCRLFWRWWLRDIAVQLLQMRMLRVHFMGILKPSSPEIYVSRAKWGLCSTYWLDIHLNFRLLINIQWVSECFHKHSLGLPLCIHLIHDVYKGSPRWLGALVNTCKYTVEIVFKLTRLGLWDVFKWLMSLWLCLDTGASYLFV